MTTFYDSDAATRAVSVYLNSVENKDLSARDILILALIAYKGEVTSGYVEKIFKSAMCSKMSDLSKKGYVKLTHSEGNYNYYAIAKEPESTPVVSDAVMYTFVNGLFNVGKYIKKYNIRKWTTLLAIAELPLHLNNLSKVNYTTKTLLGVRGAMGSMVRKELLNAGVIKPSSASQKDVYRLNKEAYFLGAN